MCWKGLYEFLGTDARAIKYVSTFGPKGSELRLKLIYITGIGFLRRVKDTLGEMYYKYFIARDQCSKACIDLIIFLDLFEDNKPRKNYFL